MNINKFKAMVDRIEQQRKQVYETKRHDYTSSKKDVDVLENFERVSQAAQILDINVHTKTGYALFMLLMKFDRFNNLYKRLVEPENESIEDTVIDAHNYLDLVYACYCDEIPSEELDEDLVIGTPDHTILKKKSKQCEYIYKKNDGGSSQCKQVAVDGDNFCSEHTKQCIFKDCLNNAYEDDVYCSNHIG